MGETEGLHGVRLSSTLLPWYLSLKLDIGERYVYRLCLREVRLCASLLRRRLRDVRPQAFLSCADRRGRRYSMPPRTSGIASKTERVIWCDSSRFCGLHRTLRRWKLRCSRAGIEISGVHRGDRHHYWSYPLDGASVKAS